MSTSATAAPAVRAALAQLIDYAGLFPPAQLAMRPALAEFTAARQGRFAWMLGRFIVPASRVRELVSSLPPYEHVELSVIIDAGSDPRTWLANVQSLLSEVVGLHDELRVRVGALEIALPPLATQRDTHDAAIGQFAAARTQAELDALPAFVELPRDARRHTDLESAMFALARHRLGAKLRCGGVSAQAFPGAAEVAAFLVTALGEHRLSMKATAGLHHPVYHRDESLGVMMHGFLNVLAAATYARAGAGAQDVQQVLESQDIERVRPGAAHLSADELRETRERSFIAYGSCSFSEPADDLQALGIL
jgi:hypothetical protein